jgi:hypothetical protein
MRKVFNLERDLRRTDWLITKVRTGEIYAQNLYAALCNNCFAPQDTWAILKNLKWHCTWRYASELIADIREDSSYDNWYCSGTGFSGTDFTGFVEESFVTPEVQTDLNTIGWLILTDYSIDYPD